jgi:hypothetical protein
MTEELAELKADWRRQDTRIDALRARLEGVRLRTRIVLALEILLTLLGVATGLFYATLAWRGRDLLFAMSALMLLVVVPVFAIPGMRLRHRSLHFPDRTPEGTLRYALARLNLEGRILRMMDPAGAALLAFVAAVWVGAGAGWIPRRYPLGVLTVVWLLSALASFLWCRWRLQRNAAESARCGQLLADFVAARTLDNGLTVYGDEDRVEQHDRTPS